MQITGLNKCDSEAVLVWFKYRAIQDHVLSQRRRKAGEEIWQERQDSWQDSSVWKAVHRQIISELCHFYLILASQIFLKPQTLKSDPQPVKEKEKKVQ